MKLWAALAACLALSACGGNGEPDWSHVPSNQRVAIHDAVTAKDCERMQTYFDASKAADVLDYLNGQMRAAGCYK